MILNMLSTAAQIRLGLVYSNLMSNLRATNESCAVGSRDSGGGMRYQREEATQVFAADEDLSCAVDGSVKSRADAERSGDTGSVRRL
jgi:hypothetical protein